METIIEIQNALTKANALYRGGEDSGLTDQQFDDMLGELEELMGEADYIQYREGLMGVGGDVVHEYVIGSLRKTKAEDDSFTKWYRKLPTRNLFIAEKLDGISIVMRFVDGVLTNASTRGDGKTGKNQTDKVKLLVSKLDTPFTGQIRGEIVMTQTNLDKLNANGGEYKNTRNTVAGVVGRKTIDVDVVKMLDVYAYQIMGSDLSKCDQYYTLESMGLRVPMFFGATSEPSIEQLVGLYNTWTEVSDYDIDGVVIYDMNFKDEDVKLPTNSIAFKVNDLVATTRIIDIQWQLSKDGLMKPVALLEPVELGGAMIARATVHNYDQVINFDIHYGDRVKLEKAGDIIPHILEVTSDNGLMGAPINTPIDCPSCGNNLSVIGVDLQCTYGACPRQELLQVESFIKRIGVKNVSEKSLSKFGINTFENIITWKPMAQYKSQTKFYKELEEKVFTSTPEELFSCLGFCGVGKTTIDKLLSIYPLAELVDGTVGVLPEGVGELTMLSIAEHALENYGIVEIITSDPRFKLKSEAPTIVGGCLDGKSFCFTGKLNDISRDEALALVEKNGGMTRSSVSGKLNYLVNNDNTSNSSKNKKAQSLGIPVITEVEFLAMTSDIDNSEVDLFSL